MPPLLVPWPILWPSSLSAKLELRSQHSASVKNTHLFHIPRLPEIIDNPNDFDMQSVQTREERLELSLALHEDLALHPRLQAVSGSVLKKAKAPWLVNDEIALAAKRLCLRQQSFDMFKLTRQLLQEVTS